MATLTIRVDPRVVRQAKTGARAHGRSVSQLVESYLSLVARPASEERDTPVLRELRGILRVTSARSTGVKRLLVDVNVRWPRYGPLATPPCPGLCEGFSAALRL